MYDTLYVILNKSENATLQYFILKVLDEKYTAKIFKGTPDDFPSVIMLTPVQ